MINKIVTGDSREVLKSMDNNSIDLIYLDPPFFTQKEHSLRGKKSEKEYSFSDKWDSIHAYIFMIKIILTESKRILKDTGSIFVQCDKAASHYIRVQLDEVFGYGNFRNEIIWNYKRWSNSKKGLLNSHQNIYFYSKGESFKFNTVYTDYSPTTNLDQILQERVRDKNGKSKYKVDENGNVVIGKEKRGVPLSDVWEIPFLNPKAKERSGYPTQKPVLLLNQILNIATDKDDIVLDPFCGSGTTCISAKLLKRKYIGIDISEEATNLTNQRLENMIVTDSALLKNGKDDYVEKDEAIISFINSIGAFPVQRNSGIDGFLKRNYDGKPVPIKIQDKNETIEETIAKLEKSSLAYNYSMKIIIQTNFLSTKSLFPERSDVIIIKSNELTILGLLEDKIPLNNIGLVNTAVDVVKLNGKST